LFVRADISAPGLVIPPNRANEKVTLVLPRFRPTGDAWSLHDVDLVDPDPALEDPDRIDNPDCLIPDDLCDPDVKIWRRRPSITRTAPESLWLWW
jgi:hypothetical protein